MKYYVNKNAQSTGEHEIHVEGCWWLPDTKNLQYLGVFFRPEDALAEAKKYYSDVDGCEHCCPSIHTK
jgi:hypothetical protein